MTPVGTTLRLDDGDYEVVDRVPQYRKDSKGKEILRSYALVCRRKDEDGDESLPR